MEDTRGVSDTTFLNVDLDVRSAQPLASLADALGTALIPLHTGRRGRRHWLRLALVRDPADPSTAILRFCRLVARLPGPARKVWDAAGIREFDIGLQAGSRLRASEWVVTARALREAADVGACIRLTVYRARPARARLTRAP